MYIAIIDNYLPYVTKTANWFKTSTSFKMVFTAANGYECIKQLNTSKILPNIILIDVQMKPIDGVAITFYLKNYYPQIKVILVSGYTDFNIIGQAIIAGADGYVFKGEKEKVLITAIEVVIAGSFYIDSRLHEIANQQTLQGIWLNKNKFWKKYTDTDTDTDTDKNKLSKREKNFVMLAATALNYTEIAELMYIEKRTVETMFARVAKKLNIANNKELALYALQNGLAINADYSFIEKIPMEFVWLL